jgi:hypothetical protein
LNKDSEQLSGRRDSERGEKVKLIAYRLWLARCGSEISGNAESDYYQAEQILESNKDLKRLLLGTFGFSTIAFVLGRSPEEHFANAIHAVLGINELELSEKSHLSSELCEKLLGNDQELRRHH